LHTECTWKEPLLSIANIRGSEALLPQYLAAQIGLRRSLDDWIPAELLPQFEIVLAKMGMILRSDCAFVSLKKSEDAVGLRYSPTTRATGMPWPCALQQDFEGVRVHVVISRRPEWAEEALESAWYPLVVDGKVIRKPLKDHEWLGHAFGYPSCCVEAFIRDNEWTKNNIYVEAASRSRHFRWETNCFPKLTAWTTVFHMPCSFDCKATVQFSTNLLREIGRFDPTYCCEIERHMRLPVLALSERTAFALHNATNTRGIISYRGVSDWYANAPNVEPMDRARHRLLMDGDRLWISNGSVLVESEGRPTGVIEAIWQDDVVEAPQLICFE